MTTGSPNMLQSQESPRIRKLRREITKAIPKFPNDRATLKLLEEKSLGSLLIDYTNWASRLIPPRPRSIVIEPTLTADSRWKSLAADTKILLDLAKAGDYLNPHLSEKTFHRGFTPTANQTGLAVNRW